MRVCFLWMCVCVCVGWDLVMTRPSQFESCNRKKGQNRRKEESVFSVCAISRREDGMFPLFSIFLSSFLVFGFYGRPDWGKFPFCQTAETETSFLLHKMKETGTGFLHPSILSSETENSFHMKNRGNHNQFLSPMCRKLKPVSSVLPTNRPTDQPTN
jgi:hypothetical protein